MLSGYAWRQIPNKKAKAIQQNKTHEYFSGQLDDDIFVCIGLTCGITCSFDHCIRPMHLAAFLHAVLAPKVSSDVVSSYVPFFSIAFSTSAHLC